MLTSESWLPAIKNLKALVHEGKFRQDLYYRLYVFELKIPPFRHRKEEILELTSYFIDRYNKQLGLKVQKIDSSLKHWLLNYHWLGNVRELQAVIERGMNIVEGNTLLLENVEYNLDTFDVRRKVVEGKNHLFITPTIPIHYIPLSRRHRSAPNDGHVEIVLQPWLYSSETCRYIFP